MQLFSPTTFSFSLCVAPHKIGQETTRRPFQIQAACSLNSGRSSPLNFGVRHYPLRPQPHPTLLPYIARHLIIQSTSYNSVKISLKDLVWGKMHFYLTLLGCIHSSPPKKAAYVREGETLVAGCISIQFTIAFRRWSNSLARFRWNEKNCLLIVPDNPRHVSYR